MWNATVKQLQEFYIKQFNFFSDTNLDKSKKACGAIRKKLQKMPESRWISLSDLITNDYKKIVDWFDKNTPQSFRKKFFYIAEYQLA